MSDEKEPIAFRRHVDYSGQVSPAFTELLAKYGASPRLSRAAQQAAGDPGRRVIDPAEAPPGARPSGPAWTGIGPLLVRAAGADPDLLRRLPRLRPQFEALGASVLGTALIAALSAVFAIDTVIGSVALALPAGLLWGVMIFLLDRTLITSAPAGGSVRRRLLAFVPRILFSTLLGVVIAVPLILRIFQPEIQANLPPGAPAGLLDQLEALNRLAEQNPSIRTAHLALLLLLVALELLPSLTALLIRLQPTDVYGSVVEVQEHYAVTDQKVDSLRRSAPVVEPATTPADVQEQIEALNEKLEELRASLEQERERDLADVIDLAERRRRRAS